MIMSKAFQLFGKMLTFSRIKITTDNLGDIQTELTNLINTKKSLSNVPIIIDSDVDLVLSELVDLLWSLGVQPIGVVDGILSKQAKTLRLAILPTDGKRIERLEAKAEPKKEMLTEQSQPSQDTPSITSVAHTQMVRSGQSIHHFGGDLTIIGGVNQGAEAITDNSLHIYGHGLGRLVAGAAGDKDARIFCQKFNPTLVSVAGTYCLSEDIPVEMIDQSVQISYDENKGLIFTLLDG